MLGALLLLAPSRSAATSLPTIVYSPTSNEGFTVTNSPRLNNRPLYGSGTPLVILSGDRPLPRFADNRNVYGVFLVGVVDSASGSGFWAHNASNVVSSFRAGQQHWVVSDDRAPGTALSIAAMPSAVGIGMVLDINSTTTTAAAMQGNSLELVWGFGCGMVASGGSAHKSYDPMRPTSSGRGGSAVPFWGFEPSDCRGNVVAVDDAHGTLLIDSKAAGITVTGRIDSSSSNSSIYASDANHWTSFFTPPPTLVSERSLVPPFLVAEPSLLNFVGADALFAEAALWLDAGTITGVPDGTKLTGAWTSGGRAGGFVSQSSAAEQPIYRAAVLNGRPAVAFDGKATWLKGALLDANFSNATSSTKTIMTVFQSTTHWVADACCSGVATLWTSSTGNASSSDEGASTNGIAVKRGDGGGTVLVLDYAGESNEGRQNVDGVATIASAVFSPTTAALNRSKCVEIASIGSGLAKPADTIALGRRASDVSPRAGPRYFSGIIAEVVVWTRVLSDTERSSVVAALETKYAINVSCPLSNTPIAAGRVSLMPGKQQRVTWTFDAGKSPALPSAAEAVTKATSRVNMLASRAVVKSPSLLLNAAAATVGASVDGLWRDDPPGFLHGAMAWDVYLVGWRSEYGGSALGWHERVAAQGRYMFANQYKEPPPGNTGTCVADSNLRLCEAAQNSRLHGKGRIHAGDGMYDMQSQMFDQQIFEWRATGNRTHEALLYPALQLHVEWAHDCFDADSNGLYHSYINTWPTDSVWFNGAETWEETSYMFTAHVALVEMATRAGDTDAAKRYQAVVDIISKNWRELWIVATGEPAAGREEGGHNRLRPDAWLYSIFCPIEARMIDSETAAQALYYTEVRLERDTVECAAPHGTTIPCGERVWTSNWVPSLWSVRQMWPGDNFATANAYYIAGLPRGGWDLLRGSMNHDMLQTVVPGLLGGNNGGTDFNDCVHPFARLLVEGFWGYRPDYPKDEVAIAPQLPVEWTDSMLAKTPASIETPDVYIGVSVEVDSTNGLVTRTVVASLKRVVSNITFHVALTDAAALKTVSVGGKSGCTLLGNYSVQSGFGQTVVVATVLYGGTTGAGCMVGVEYTPLSSRTHSVTSVDSIHANVSRGEVLNIATPLTVLMISDPQGVLVLDDKNSTSSAAVTIAENASIGFHSFFVYCATVGGLPQTVQFKLNISASPSAPPPPQTGRGDLAIPPDATWRYIDMNASNSSNAHLSNIFKMGTYLSPRPKTCSARIGSDGWSAWTFAHGQGTPGPVPDWRYVENLTVPGGFTPGGATRVISPQRGGNASSLSPSRFKIAATPAAVEHNIAFASMWDNFPTVAHVAISDLSAAVQVWVLIAGSTNPMQTRLANAVLRFVYDDGVNETLQLVPPDNFWSLSTYGANDYDYSTDAFCLPDRPPVTCQLGHQNRAMVYSWMLREQEGVQLVAVELEALSQEVVIGIVAVSVVL